MKAQRGIGVLLYSFCNLGARWGWVVNATLQPLYLQDRDHCIGCWVGPKSDLHKKDTC